METPLFYAAWKGHLKCVEFLVAENADVLLADEVFDI